MTREYVKSNFQFIDSLYQTLEDYIQAESSLNVEDKLFYGP